MPEETQTTEQTTEQKTEQTKETILGKQTQTQETQTEETKEPTILNTPVSPVKPDGTFIENWKQTLPEDLREEKALDTVTDFNNAIKQLVHHKKMVGANKVVIPNEKSSEEEVNAFYEALGTPKTETGYNVPEIPEELKEIYDDASLEAAKKFAYSIHATQQQFQEYLKFDMQKVKGLMAEDDQALVQERQDAQKNLRTEFGAAYDERIHVANRLIQEAFPKEEDRMGFLEKFGNDVDFIRFASRVGARMSEHTALIGELTQKTPNEIQGQIAKLRATPGYMQISSDMTKEDRQRITDEILELERKLNPPKKAG
jgi:hypothetical protein